MTYDLTDLHNFSEKINEVHCITDTFQARAYAFIVASLMDTYRITTVIMDPDIVLSDDTDLSGVPTEDVRTVRNVLSQCLEHGVIVDSSTMYSGAEPTEYLTLSAEDSNALVRTAIPLETMDEMNSMIDIQLSALSTLKEK